MLAYKDFAPRMTAQPAFFKPAQFESLDQTLAAANRWIAESGVQLLNVETVVLPNVHSPHEQGTSDPSLHSSGEMATSWHQFIRCWYKQA